MYNMMKERDIYVIKIVTIFRRCVYNKVVVCEFGRKSNNEQKQSAGGIL